MKLSYMMKELSKMREIFGDVDVFVGKKSTDEPMKKEVGLCVTSKDGGYIMIYPIK